MVVAIWRICWLLQLYSLAWCRKHGKIYLLLWNTCLMICFLVLKTLNWGRWNTAMMSIRSIFQVMKWVWWSSNYSLHHIPCRLSVLAFCRVYSSICRNALVSCAISVCLSLCVCMMNFIIGSFMNFVKLSSFVKNWEKRMDWTLNRLVIVNLKCNVLIIH